jgi:hypothetical protein
MGPDDRFDATIRSATILAQARAGNWGTAAHDINDLAAAHGPAGIQILCMGLADTLVIHQDGFARDNEVSVPLWVDEDGNASEADAVARHEIRWAGRFVAARAAGDTDACRALWDSITGEDEFRANVCGLLEVAATTLNAIGAPA